VNDKDRLGLYIILTYEDYERRMAEEFAASDSPDQRISDRHRAIFMHLSLHGATRSVDLANAIGIRPQSMMKLVHELEAMGLISRRVDPTDARAKLIEFTPDGERLQAQFRVASSQVWDKYEDILGERKLNQLCKSLSLLLESQGIL
jgi:DNA-binding MarR family transcriptional regulator